MSKKAQFSPHLYADWAELFKVLTDKQKADVLMAITLYPDYEPENNPVWGFIKLQIDKEYQAFNERCEKNQEIANARWSNKENANVCERIPEENKKCERMPITETRTRIITETEKEKESVKKKVAIASHFQKPSLEQVMAYCQARNNTVDAERFMDFYESKGWKVGNQPMKDWEAAVRTWEKREQPKVELALPSKVTETKIDEIVENRKKEDEEQRKRAEEANRRSEFIKGKGYQSMLALISAGKEVYDRVMSEYKQAQGF